MIKLKMKNEEVTQLLDADFRPPALCHHGFAGSFPLASIYSCSLNCGPTGVRSPDYVFYRLLRIYTHPYEHCSASR